MAKEESNKKVELEKELVVVFHCDPCGKTVKIVGVDPKQDDSISCPFCKTGGGKFYPYDDYYLIPTKKKKV